MKKRDKCTGRLFCFQRQQKQALQKLPKNKYSTLMKTRYLSLLLLLSVFLSSDIFAQKPADSTCTIVLHGHWSIQSSASLTDDGKVISQPGYTAKGWYPTSIPSTVLAALVANKMYPDPYYGNNYMELPGVRRWDKPEGNPFESSWWYRTEFEVPASYSDKHLSLIHI